MYKVKSLENIAEIPQKSTMKINKNNGKIKNNRPISHYLRLNIKNEIQQIEFSNVLTWNHSILAREFYSMDTVWLNIA